MPSGLSALTQIMSLMKNVKETSPEGQLRGDVKATTNEVFKNILAGKEALRTLKEIGEYKKKVNTGEIVSSPNLFGASIPKYDDKGEEKQPGLLQAIMTKAFPKQTTDMQELDARIKHLNEMAFIKGGKALTGSEKATVFGPMPSVKKDDKQFDARFEGYKKNMENYIKSQIQTLKSLGYDDQVILNTLKEYQGK